MDEGLFGRLEDQVTARKKNLGIMMADVLTMPDAESELISWMIRETEVGLDQIVAHLKKDEPSARALIEALLEQGYVREFEVRGATRYRVQLAPKRKREMMENIWRALDDQTPE